jgi:hypothetical protein
VSRRTNVDTRGRPGHSRSVGNTGCGSDPNGDGAGPAGQPYTRDRPHSTRVPLREPRVDTGRCAGSRRRCVGIQASTRPRKPPTGGHLPSKNGWTDREEQEATTRHSMGRTLAGSSRCRRVLVAPQTRPNRFHARLHSESLVNDNMEHRDTGPPFDGMASRARPEHGLPPPVGPVERHRSRSDRCESVGRWFPTIGRAVDDSEADEVDGFPPSNEETTPIPLDGNAGGCSNAVPTSSGPEYWTRASA